MSAAVPLLHRPAFDGTLGSWRTAARRLIGNCVPPGHVEWIASGQPQSGGGELQQALGLLVERDAAQQGPPTHAEHLRVPKRFLELASLVACHRDASRWHLLYAVLWRLAHREPHVLDLSTDDDVHRLLEMERAVRRAAHKMKAFVRFREVRLEVVDRPEGNAPAVRNPVYVAWFEPAHDVVALTAPFFARRFASMRWSILTPDRCAHWDQHELHLTGGVSRAEAPGADALETLWRTYYAHTFNPARLRVRMMKSEMPQSYWHLLPEAPLIADLVRTAPRRVATMIAQVAAPPEAIPAALAAGADATRVAPPRQARRAARHDGDDGEFTPAALTRPGRVDPDHDPGTTEACRRACLVEKRVVAEGAAGVRVGDARIAVGVAGWTDPTILRGEVFYPVTARTAESRLRHYATRFGMVEGDSGYYVLPTAEMTARWVERTPDGFSFDVKAHALMTGHPADVAKLPAWIARTLPPALRSARHIYARHLSAGVLDEVWARFLEAIEPLRKGGRLGAVFLQYPRWFIPSRDAAAELADARRRLGGVPGAVEFRHRTWMEEMAEHTCALLEQLGLAYTIVDAPQGMDSSMPPAARITAPHLAVIRLHGRRTSTWERRNTRVTERYRYLYDRDELASWVPRILDVAKQHQRVHVVFNNNHANYATTNALELSSMLLDAC